MILLHHLGPRGLLLAAITIASLLLVACSGGSGAGTPSALEVTQPPAPDASLNRATIAGIDSNVNGVRDDVELLAAETFGNQPEKYRQAVSHARAEQLLITAQTEAAADAYIQEVNCNRLTAAELNRLTLQQLDTEARREAYARMLAGRASAAQECTR